MQPLLHIGYHKTGTTFLQERVFPEPGFSLTAGGEALRPIFVNVDAFCFDADAARESIWPKIEIAAEQGLVPVLSAERLSGNPHSGGYDSKQIAERLAATVPEARVLIVIREQTDMLVSAYKQYVKRGGPGTLRQYTTPPSTNTPVPLFNFRFFDYHRLIGCYQGLFGAENVLVLPYELLKRNPATFLARIGSFADTHVATSDFEVLNVSPSTFSLSFKRWANRWVVRDDVNPAPPFEIEGANRALLELCYKTDVMVPAKLRARHEGQLRVLAKELVGERYAGSNAITVKLSKLNLPAFGYTCR